MCVCVFLRSMCLKFLLRDVFERLLCWLDHWLSCMLDCIHVCVFHISKKLFLRASSTPPRDLLDTLLSVELLQLFLIAFPRWLPRYLSILASIKLYWGSIYSFLRDLILISSIFLDFSVPFYLPNTISLSLQTSSFVIFQAFSRFFFSW